MADTYGVLLLSCVRHQGTYAPVFAAHPDVEIVAVADEPDIPAWMHEVNQQFADEYGLPYIRNVPEALSRPDVDFVSICSEPTRHARLAIASANHGKHVLLDKPMATTVEDALDVVDAIDRAGVTFTFVNRLYSPAIQQTRAAIDRGEIGLPYALDVSFVSAGGLTTGSVEDFQLVVDRDLSGGGELMNFLGYPIETVQYLTGLEITDVYASAGNYFFDPHREHGVEDFGVVLLTLERGVIATATVGRTPTPNHPRGGEHTVRVHGSSGSRFTDEGRPSVALYAPSPAPSGFPPHSVVDVMISPLIDDFVACLREGQKPIRSARDGLAVIAVIEAAYRSIRSGRRERVMLPEANRKVTS
jgi:myo-inositol 2-dehydrogenase / D-chiro-inositol 1-dehydrogenase